MRLLDRFRLARQPRSANLAKERLQIIISHERIKRQGPDFLPKLQQELLAVIAKYVTIEPERVKVELDRQDDCSILELNVTLPDELNDSKS
jgi:cell division topological specificity factor